ncbi:hypothetical protein [uncultured Thalassolituus sp.]|uniref:hypothetical protein n=1 Tax=uncultured Thalassolituus sp. TaxID=285273 RepID=UPI0026169228|nr:hypothetical protein [uncultured Thalassolituus sp.]
MISGAFLASSLAIFWFARKQAGRPLSGEQAADLCAALLLSLYGALSLLAHWWQHPETLHILQGLSWYAAVPLMVLVSLLRAAQTVTSLTAWDRVVWGRILLALCVVYELARRSEVLEWIPVVTMICGFGASLMIAMAYRHAVSFLALLAWGIAGAWSYLQVPPAESVVLSMTICSVLDRLAYKDSPSKA